MHFIRHLSVAVAMAAAPLTAGAQAPQVPPLPETAPDTSRQVEAPRPRAETGAVTARGSGPSFVLNGIVLEGATALDQKTISPIWQELIGQRVTVQTLDEVTRQISAAYRERGYVLSQAILPAQTVDGGIVRIVVVEGFVDQITYSGGAANQQDLVTEYFGPVADDRPLRLTTLERSVLLSRDAVGSVNTGSVETVLGPSPDTFGAADLDVQIAQQPVSGYVSIDNRGSRLYGDWTLGTGARAFNLLGLNETLDGNFALAPQGTSLAFGSITADVPLRGLTGTWLDGARLRFGGNIFRGDPDLAEAGATAGLTTVSDQTELNAQLVVPFVRARSENVFGRFGLTFRDSETETGLVGLTTVEEDRLAVLEAGVAWDFADRLGGISLVDVSLRQGLDVAGARVSATGPAAGDLNFTSAQVTLSRLQALGSGPWSVFGEITGQMSRGLQPNSERFYLGGSSIGRGFAPGNTSGDTGYAGRAELRRAISPDSLGTVADAASLYAFIDYGRAYDRSIARDGQQWENLGSIGIGAQISLNTWLSVTPQIVRQISGTPRDTVDPSQETRFFIGAVARF
ncbi:POTRA domain-containing protein [uncultured Roseobacter sp.]|uniref:ShlB/FhaC/HecB family hemolysin secretion/activation protein n=1 Tax=uncultured Roseobacter sp. TaxID=114847 RepID=UPI002623DC24|nr:POTRA domain-containing protein [uncultured Roseobacter sp.]